MMLLSLIIIVISLIIMFYWLRFPKDNDEWLAHSAITCFILGTILFICCAIYKLIGGINYGC